MKRAEELLKEISETEVRVDKAFQESLLSKIKSEEASTNDGTHSFKISWNSIFAKMAYSLSALVVVAAGVAVFESYQNNNSIDQKDLAAKILSSNPVFASEKENQNGEFLLPEVFESGKNYAQIQIAQSKGNIESKCLKEIPYINDFPVTEVYSYYKDLNNPGNEKNYHTLSVSSGEIKMLDISEISRQGASSYTYLGGKYILKDPYSGSSTIPNSIAQNGSIDELINSMLQGKNTNVIDIQRKGDEIILAYKNDYFCSQDGKQYVSNLHIDSESFTIKSEDIYQDKIDNKNLAFKYSYEYIYDNVDGNKLESLFGIPSELAGKEIRTIEDTSKVSGDKLYTLLQKEETLLWPESNSIKNTATGVYYSTYDSIYEDPDFYSNDKYGRDWLESYTSSSAISPKVLVRSFIGEPVAFTDDIAIEQYSKGTDIETLESMGRPLGELEGKVTIKIDGKDLSVDKYSCDAMCGPDGSTEKSVLAFKHNDRLYLVTIKQAQLNDLSLITKNISENKEEILQSIDLMQSL